MISGAIIVESLRPGTHLRDLRLVVHELYRFRPTDRTAEQKETWTVLEFEASEDDAASLAHSFAEVLDRPGWYVEFRSLGETFVVFPERVFQYARGDKVGRAEVQAHGRLLGIPETQLDWPV